MANRERNKRSARQARQRERAALEAQSAAGGAASNKPAAKTASHEGSSAPAKKVQTEGTVGRVRTYFRDVRSEMNRVVWPSRKELTNYSVAVVVMLIIFGVLVWAVDTGFVALLVAFTSLRG